MALTWTVNFDWTTAGTFDTSRNDAVRMVDYKLVRGRREFINGSGNGLEAVEPGMVQIKLDNYDGIYDPYNTSSVLYPKVEPGRYINVTVDSGHGLDDSYSKILLHFDDERLIDESRKKWFHNFTEISGVKYKFGGASLRCEQNYRYCYTENSSDFVLGSGDWTWDFWVNFDLIGAATYTLVYQEDGTGENLFRIQYYAPSDILICEQLESGAHVWNFRCSWNPSNDQWYHVEIARNGNTPLIFIDGDSKSITETTTISGKTASAIAGNMNIGAVDIGKFYLDEVRFSNGIARHTTSFTPNTDRYLSSDSERHRFTGKVDSIEKIGDVTNPQVLITAYDGLKDLQNNKVTTAIVSGSTAAKTGTQITYMTTSAEWPSIYGTSSIDAGNGIIPYMWANEMTAFQTIKDIADVEAGLFCAKADGSFYFRPREATTSVITLDQSVMLKDILLTSPYKLNRNAAKVYIYDKSLPESSAVKLWKMNDVPLVSTSAGLTVWGRYKYSGNDCAGYGMVAPVDTTDFKMNTKADGTGTDRTDKWDVTTTYFGEVSKNVITNVTAVKNHYCTLLKNRGKPIVSDESTYKVYDHAGTAAVRTLTIDDPFIQTSWQSEFYDSFMDQLTATTLRFPIFQMEAQPESQFSFDLFDKITVTIPKYGINGDYIVGGIEEEWLTDNGQAVLTTVYTEPNIIVTPPTVLAGE